MSNMVPAATRFARAIAVCAAAAALAGCVETLPEIEASAPVQRDQIVRRADVSPRGAPVAFASIEGGSRESVARFANALRFEVESREIAISESKVARYVLRGYLDARPVREGVAISYVWDVFDARHSRVRRLTDELVVKAAPGEDAWASLDETAIASVAGRSADELAAFLSNTPEAIVASRSPAAKAAAKIAAKPASEAVAQAE